MKKNVLFLFIMAAIAISGCKKDNKKDDELKSTIAGKWFTKKIVEVNYVNNVKKEEHTDTDFGNNDFFEFKADGTGIFSEIGDTDPFTYKVTGDILTITYMPGESLDFKIKSLIGNDAVFVNEFSEIFENVNYKTVTEITVKK
ncbi:lipocalin family protein [Pedobacter psychroterrae]|uniref:Lipocalin-like domain-containing protein n=1 Tax=Pedobacter psychroterrae TaxID=2530453 RepID=A0A4R0NPE5_9SPHI|nr:lipocalin family protein [Pedobacter psychroterrae]TCD02801.1 hypothetical protein EZ437_02090 [Pedobacter psychroterrae]